MDPAVDFSVVWSFFFVATLLVTILLFLNGVTGERGCERKAETSLLLASLSEFL